MKRGWRHGRNSLLTLLLVLVLSTAGLWLVLASTSGNRWLVGQVPQWVPGELEITGWQGNLVDGATLARLVYRLNGFTLQISQLSLALDVTSLWQGALVATKLQAAHVSIVLPARDPAKAPVTSLRLPFPLAVKQLDVAQLTLHRDTHELLLNAVHARRLRAWQQLHVDQLRLTYANLALDGQGTLGLAAPWTLVARLDWRRDTPPLRAAGHLFYQGDLHAGTVQHELLSPLHISSTGTLRWPAAIPVFDISHRWPAQPLTSVTSAPLALGAGELVTRGALDALQLTGKSILVIRGVPLTLTLGGTATPQALHLTTLALTHQRQRLDLQGSLEIGNTIAWQLRAQGEHLDASPWLPDWPGDLTLTGTSQGKWQSGKNWQASAENLTLKGLLKQKHFSLHADLAPAGKARLHLNTDARWQTSRLTAHGTLSQQLDLQGKLLDSQLADWFVGANGNADLDWHLTGPLAQPLLAGRLTSQQPSYAGWQLASLDARFAGLSTGNALFSLSLHGKSLSKDSTRILDDVSASLAGRRSQHQLELALHYQKLAAQLRLQASLGKHWNWQGTLLHAELDLTEAGLWQLRAPTGFQLRPDVQRLDHFCLDANTTTSQLCLAAVHSPRNWQLSMTPTRLPLALANPWLNQALQLQGYLNGQAEIRGERSLVSGHWKLALDAGQVHISTVTGKTSLAFDTATLAGAVQNQRVHNRLVLTTPNRLALQAWTEHGITRTAPLQGQLQLDLPDLGFLAPLLPQVGKLEGALHGQLTLAGTLAEPAPSGDITLQQGRITLPGWGVEATRVGLKLTGTPQGLALSGTAFFGQQPLRLNGQWTHLPSLSGLAVNLSGQHLLLLNSREATLYVSPDLLLTGHRHGLTLSGQVGIPEARLEPRALPDNAISVSPDQVIVNAAGMPQRLLPLTAAVNVRLGEAVRFNGFGLNARLGGELAVQQITDQPMQLHGTLRIRDGRYKAYGQNLAIDQGALLFEGPATDPGLDIRALRKIPNENLEVGVLLSGTLQKPQAQIFSNPLLEESEAMAYLLTGHGLTQSNNSDTARIAQAIMLYGLQKGEGATQKLGNSLGIDDISFGSDWGDANEASLMLGKQLTDRLYLRYAIGLFENLSTVMMRYTLGRTFHLEAQTSGENQSIDLIWQKEIR